MVHVQTGNGLDVVYDYEDDLMVIKGLYQQESRGENTARLIPLPNPQGLANVLIQLIEEMEKRNGKTQNQ